MIGDQQGRDNMRLVLVRALQMLDAGTLSPVSVDMIACEPDALAGPHEPVPYRRSRFVLTLEETYVPGRSADWMAVYAADPLLAVRPVDAKADPDPAVYVRSTSCLMGAQPGSFEASAVLSDGRVLDTRDRSTYEGWVDATRAGAAVAVCPVDAKPDAGPAL